jgi:hypothetical protein
MEQNASLKQGKSCLSVGAAFDPFHFVDEPFCALPDKSSSQDNTWYKDGMDMIWINIGDGVHQAEPLKSRVPRLSRSLAPVEQIACPRQVLCFQTNESQSLVQETHPFLWLLLKRSPMGGEICFLSRVLAKRLAI